MSLDPPTYLLSLQNNIRARPIPWESAARAGQISEVNYKRIKLVDKVRKEQRRQTVEKDTDGFCALLLGGGEKETSIFESAVKRVDVTQYTIVLAGDMIEDIQPLATTLLAHPQPYRPFLPLLTHPEDPIPLLASSLLTSLLSKSLESSSSLSSESKSALKRLYSYIATLAKSSDFGLQDIAVQEYSALLCTKESRELFWQQRDETVKPLIEILRLAARASQNGDGNNSAILTGSSSLRSPADTSAGGSVGLQLLYHVLLVIWQLSFEASLIGDHLNEEFDIVALYTQLLRISPKEKTTRLLVSTLYHLTSSKKSTLLPAAVIVRLPALLQNLSGRQLSDPDLLEDIKILSEMLDDYTKTQTTFDEYAAEVRSGHLRWSPPHRSLTFWSENSQKILEENNGEIPKRLAEIMAKPWDTDKQVLAIACNDVGCLVKEIPEKRGQLEKLGLKARVMELMSEEDKSIKWESLKATGEWLRYSFE
ncbi:MAG: H(+)-transporting V1 sector ATPase subunit H [Trizodia sp. TS-e1964]|nr:MAG: H(+)-transporting V1 sector ATPase subunit H [Trizodia sp. TS-e1964]